MFGHWSLVLFVLLLKLSGRDLVLITGRVSLSVDFLSRCIFKPEESWNRNLKDHCSLSLTKSKGVYST